MCYMKYTLKANHKIPKNRIFINNLPKDYAIFLKLT